MKNMRQKLITALTAAVACFLLIPTAAADQVIADDLIVQSSVCVGFDCVNGESFGFDTIRLKENNLRIKAEDTSLAAGFPSTDWQITFNDSANGGQNKFSVEDITAARVPFTIEAGTPSNSLYVDSTHRIGFGTSTPVLDLHVNSSNTPGLRLEQNSSGGFSAQIWDVAGNEANFFVRDVTGGSKLPFRIRPGARTSAIDVAANGNVGIGTSSPAEELDIRPTGDNEGELAFHNDDTAAPWVMRHRPEANGGFFHFDNGGGAVELALSPAGALTILGSITTGGPTCGTGCDFVFDPGYKMESIEEHAEMMWENSHLPAVGKTPEQGTSFNVTEKVGGMLNELEKAHIYIERLNEKLKEKDAEVGELTVRLARLEALMSK